ITSMLFFFFNDPATTEIYTLSLHDALPICGPLRHKPRHLTHRLPSAAGQTDRKSTRLNSSHTVISYAVFCLKKKLRYTAALMPRKFWALANEHARDAAG